MFIILPFQQDREIEREREREALAGRERERGAGRKMDGSATKCKKDSRRTSRDPNNSLAIKKKEEERTS